MENWKKGSARQRGLVPFTGATVTKTRVTLVDAFWSNSPSRAKQMGRNVQREKAWT
jgi:hypothetical protein